MPQPGSFPAYGTGVYLAADGSGMAEDLYVPIIVSSGSATASFPVPGTGAFFAAAGGTGTADDPFIPLVAFA